MIWISGHSLLIQSKLNQTFWINDNYYNIQVIQLHLLQNILRRIVGLIITQKHPLFVQKLPVLQNWWNALFISAKFIAQWNWAQISNFLVFKCGISCREVELNGNMLLSWSFVSVFVRNIKLIFLPVAVITSQYVLPNPPSLNPPGSERLRGILKWEWKFIHSIFVFIIIIIHSSIVIIIFIIIIIMLPGKKTTFPKLLNKVCSGWFGLLTARRDISEVGIFVIYLKTFRATGSSSATQLSQVYLKWFFFLLYLDAPLEIHPDPYLFPGDIQTVCILFSEVFNRSSEKNLISPRSQFVLFLSSSQSSQTSYSSYWWSVVPALDPVGSIHTQDRLSPNHLLHKTYFILLVMIMIDENIFYENILWEHIYENISYIAGGDRDWWWELTAGDVEVASLFVEGEEGEVHWAGAC